MEKEIWKDVKNYEGLYQISNKGRVKSLGNDRSRKEKILKLLTNKKGYLQVNLYINSKMKTFRVHRLVAETFIPNPNNYPEINHKDEDKTNNCVENIEYCTHEYNSNYGSRTERAAQACSKPVLQIDKTTNEVIAEWQSTHEVERKLGFNNSAISKCCTGKRKTCGGFRWSYKT